MTSDRLAARDFYLDTDQRHTDSPKASLKTGDAGHQTGTTEPLLCPCRTRTHEIAPRTHRLKLERSKTGRGLCVVPSHRITKHTECTKHISCRLEVTPVTGLCQESFSKTYLFYPDQILPVVCGMWPRPLPTDLRRVLGAPCQLYPTHPEPYLRDTWPPSSPQALGLPRPRSHRGQSGVVGPAPCHLPD